MNWLRRRAALVGQVLRAESGAMRLGVPPAVLGVFLIAALAASVLLPDRRDGGRLEAADDNCALAVGVTVSNGSPCVGAGNIEVAGNRDIYTFTAAAGDVVYFDSLTNCGGIGSSARWVLRSSAALNNVVFDQAICGEPGLETLTLGGTYTITVGASDTATGTYSFRTYDVPDPQPFVIAVGDTVQNGVPQAGAGNIELVGSQDVYTFQANPGQVVNFDSLTTCGGIGSSARWVLRSSEAPPNNVVFDQAICGDPGLETLTLGGTYTITVGASDTATGTYSFSLTSDTLPPATATPTQTPPQATATATLPASTPTPPAATATTPATPAATATQPAATATQTTVPATATQVLPTVTHTPPPPTSTPTEPPPTSTFTPVPTATSTETQAPTFTHTATPTTPPDSTATHTPIPATPTSTSSTPTQVPATATRTVPPTATFTRVAPESTATARPTETPRPQEGCGGADLSGDGKVTARDINLMAFRMGAREYVERYDLNGDGHVNPRDLIVVIRCMQAERGHGRGAH